MYKNMYKMLKYRGLFWWAMILCVMVIPSCRKGPLDEPQMGKVSITLSRDSQIEVRSSSDEEDVEFKFVGLNGYGSSEEFIPYTGEGMEAEWYFGIYRLYAQTCSLEEAELGFGCVRHDGTSEPFTIVNGQVVPVSAVVCRVANCRVTVNFDMSMYEAFDDFKFFVRTVKAPVEGEETVSDGDTEEDNVLRTLEFNKNGIGYYNLYDTPLNLEYILSVRANGAEEYVETARGYLLKEESGAEPAILAAGDAVTFNVRYTGQIDNPSSDLVFVIDGMRYPSENGITLPDYSEGGVNEES